MSTAVAACILSVILMAAALVLSARYDRDLNRFRKNLQPGTYVFFTFNRKPCRGRVVNVFSHKVHIMNDQDHKIYSIIKTEVFRA